MNIEVIKNNITGLEQSKEKTIYRVIKNKENPYVQINKTAFDDKRLSMKSKGLHGYMLTKPDDWRFHRDEILNHCTDGKDSLKTAIKELVTLGYLSISEKRSPDGKFAYWETSVYETPELNPFFQNTENQYCGKVPTGSKASSRSGFPTSGFPTCGKSASTNNDLILKNKTNTKKTTTQEIVIPNIESSIKSVEYDVVVKLKELGVEPAKAKELARKHTIEQIEEMALKCNLNPERIESPAAWIVKGLKEGWNFGNGKKAKNKAPTPRIIYSRSENASWFQSLPESQRNKIYEDTVFRIPHLPEMLQNLNIPPLSDDFLTSTWFKDVMETAKRWEK